MAATRSLLAVATAIGFGLTLASAPAQGELTTIYEETFNSFNVGQPLDGQGGWDAIPANAVIATAGAGGRRIGVEFTSLTSGTGFRRLAVSPTFADFPNPVDDDFVVTTVIGFRSDRSSWYITPVNQSQNLVLTRVKFQAGGTISVLVPDGFGGGVFEPVNNVTWVVNEAYTLNLVFRKEGIFQLAFSSRGVAQFESTAFTSGVEAVQFECDNERTGSKMLMDEIRVRQGNLNF